MTDYVRSGSSPGRTVQRLNEDDSHSPRAHSVRSLCHKSPHCALSEQRIMIPAQLFKLLFVKSL